MTRCAPTIQFPLFLLVKPHLLPLTSRWKAWVGRNRNRDRNRNFDFNLNVDFCDSLPEGEGVQHEVYPTYCHWLCSF